MSQDLEPPEHDPASARPRVRGKRSWHRRWKQARRSVGLALVGRLGPFALRRLRATWQVERLHAERWEAVGGASRGVILALWHGRMVCGMTDHGGREYHVLVSRSRDGDISERLLRRFGYEVIRGSSSRGGASAARAMLGALARGGALVVTPDGPRGPRHTMNPGIAWMARETGFPILPLGFACDRAWYAASWDRFTLPKLGARVVLSYGEPIHVASDADADALARATQRVRDELLAAERVGFAHLAKDPDW